MAQFTHRKEQKHLNQQKGAPGSAALTELHTLRTVRTEPVANYQVQLRRSPPGGAGAEANHL